jgi:hypothetical protein
LTGLSRKLWLSMLLCLLVTVSFLFIHYLPSSASPHLPTSTPEVEYDETEDDEEDQAVEESIEFASPSKTRDLITFDIFEDIARARALLEPMKCDFTVVSVMSAVNSKSIAKKKSGAKSKKVKKKVKGKSKGRTKKSQKRVIVRRELGDFTILLAVEDVKTREIQVVRVHPKLGGRSKGVLVEPGKSNGVNTKFTIVYPEHHVVLALKRPVRHGATFEEVIYTPYSDGLDIPQVRQAGLEYLKDTVRAAKTDLLRRGVSPLSCDRFVADDVSVTLAIIEHIDPLKFESGKYTTEQLIHETLVIMGTNRQNAYQYSRSKAGARGLFQFIPDTYKRIVRLYPRAGLNPDFAHGMEDHVNAAKAAFLLFDADTRVLNNGRKEHLVNEPDAWGRFLASAYNCGSGKTRGAMDRHGNGWPRSVPSETQIYIKKYDAARDWLRLQP